MKTKKLTACICGKFLAAIGLALMAAVTARANYQSTVLADKPLAYFTLDLTVDNSGTAADLSGNGNNSEYYNIYPTTGPATYITNAAIFTGSSLESYVDLSSGNNPGLLNFNGTITMEAWVQPANTTESPADILGKGYDGVNEITLRANGGNYYGGFYTNGNTYAASGGVQTTNWAYLVSTYDGTNWNLYVNGTLVQANPSPIGVESFSTPWAIGVGTPISGGRWFAGNICQVAIYTNALTAAQVLTHYYSAELNASPSSSPPIINTQPQSQSSYTGGSATFSVAAVSASSLTNQWFHGNSPLLGQTNSTLTLNNLLPSNAGNYSVVVGNANGTTNSTVATLTVNTPANLQWSPNNNNGTWDTSTTANWINLANSQQVVFNPGDQVLFDDTANVPTNVTLNGTVVPSLITVNSSVNNFNLSGGNIGGSGSLTKSGSSVLNIVSGGGFTGTVAINGGLVYAGNNCFNAVSQITITNNSTMDLGGGTLNNNKPITISGIGINGQGAINNSYGDDPQESVNITLTGDTKFGVTQRWDLASGSQINGATNLTIDLSGGGYSQWNSVSVGGLASITVTNGTLGSVGNDTAFQNPSTVLIVDGNSTLHLYGGGWNSSVHVLSGGQVYLDGQSGNFTGNSLVLESNTQWQSYYNSGNKFINSAVTLNGVAHFVIGDHNMIYTNVISGAGGFVSDYYNHAMVFSAVNTYTGPTIIGSGPEVALTNNGSIFGSSLIFFGGSDPTVTHIDVTGRADQTLTLTSGQTLAGIGAVNGKLVVSPGAVISPSGTNTTIGITTGANSTGTLAASNTITLNGTTVLKLSGSGVNDQVQSSVGITYGGTLSLVNISGSPLAVGNTFQVFNAPSYSGSFTNITPATPSTGLAWDLSQLNMGFVGVKAGSTGPVISHPQIIGGNLVFSGTGGTNNGSYHVLTTTNLTTALANWTVLSSGTFDASGNFAFTNAIGSSPQQFYLIKQP